MKEGKKLACVWGYWKVEKGCIFREEADKERMMRKFREASL